MPRFCVEDELIVGSNYNLPEPVARHINVLRLRLHAEIVLFNGNGNNYLSEIIEISKRNILVNVKKCDLASTESELKITLLMSIIANDKFDLVLQKAVELGVDKIIPVYTQNTQRFKSDKLPIKMEHWRKVIISASEQCGRAVLMQLAEPETLVKVVPYITTEAKFALSPHHVTEAVSNKFKDVTLLIGPEGGFTDDEIDLTLRNGFRSLLLGKRILRAETAVFAAISVMQCLTGDFK